MYSLSITTYKLTPEGMCSPSGEDLTLSQDYIPTEVLIHRILSGEHRVQTPVSSMQYDDIMPNVDLEDQVSVENRRNVDLLDIKEQFDKAVEATKRFRKAEQEALAKRKESLKKREELRKQYYQQQDLVRNTELDRKFEQWLKNRAPEAPAKGATGL